MMYSEFEAAKIFKNCRSHEEVITAASAFGRLQTNYGEKVPFYVVSLANLRFRKLIK